MKSTFQFATFTVLLATSLVNFSARETNAEDRHLFNGKNLDGWTFEPQDEEAKKIPVEKVWGVRNGQLVNYGTASGYLLHESDFENYLLTFEWRSMELKGNGVAVGGTGTLLVHTGEEMGSFLRPKSIEISMFRDSGDIYFRDVEPFAEKKWNFSSPDYADDLPKELGSGQWNVTKVICNKDWITVLLNGVPINQISNATRTKGKIGLTCHSSFVAAPSFYRNIRVEPLSETSASYEKQSTQTLAKFRKIEAEKEARENAARIAKEEREAAEEAARKAEIEKQRAAIQVEATVPFSNQVTKLPFPRNKQPVEFDSTFGDVEYTTPHTMLQMAKFYRTELARRGWEETDYDSDEESIDLEFKHGDATIDLSLDQESNFVEVSLDTDGMSYDGTEDPAGMASRGFPQPAAYLFLQKEFTLPTDARDVEFDDEDSCKFKSNLGLQQCYDFLCGQLRKKGYRETRKPIANATRRYTEFARGGKEVSINVFSHEQGSRAILETE